MECHYNINVFGLLPNFHYNKDKRFLSNKKLKYKDKLYTLHIL